MRGAAAALWAAAVGCGESAPADPAPAPTDTGSGETGGRSDTGRSDTVRSDTGRGDTGRGDTVRSDTVRSDTGSSDTGRSDTGQSDTGRSGALPLCVNEWMASNGSSWVDPLTGARDDWIELFNPPGADVSLAGWHLSDDLADPMKHALDPTLVVPAGGALLLFASGDTALGPAHLGFSLSADGESIVLTDPRGDGEAIHYGALGEDLALARSPDCCPDVAACATVVIGGTPGLSNVPVVLVEEELVAAGSEWRWQAAPTPADPLWMLPGFDDSTWSAGPGFLGYGDPHVATVVDFGGDPYAKWVSTPFRREVTVTDAAGVIDATVYVARDDGFVLWINGVEVLRDNLPAGAIDDQTLALGAAGGADETAYRGFRLPAGTLVEGVNTLAVRVHQAAPDSSDLGFDLRLVVTRPSP